MRSGVDLFQGTFDSQDVSSESVETFSPMGPPPGGRPPGPPPQPGTTVEQPPPTGTKTAPATACPAGFVYVPPAPNSTAAGSCKQQIVAAPPEPAKSQKVVIYGLLSAGALIGLAFLLWKAKKS
jgi:hypothetical protein